MILIGVDGGGSRTRAVAVDGEGDLQATARLGCGNYQIIGLEGLETLIAEMVDKLGVSADYLGLGLAGAGRAVERKSILGMVRERFGFKSTIVATDAQVALVGAHGGEVGLIAVSGTGSIVLGRDASGREARAGGWGSILGDDGSGYDIGRGALRAVLATLDGSGPETVLSRTLFGALTLTEWEELIPVVQTGEISRQEIAALCPVVFAAAKEGDLVAGEIVEKAGVALGNQVAAVIRSLGMSGSVPLTCVGGVFREIDLLWSRLADSARRAGATLYRHDPLLPPVLGAVLLAAGAIPAFEPFSMIEKLVRVGEAIESDLD